MNPRESKPKKGLNCRDCGADNSPDARECWLCLRSDWRPGAAARSEPSTWRPDAADRSKPSTAARMGGLGIAWLTVLIAMNAVVGGIAAQNRFLGAVLWIILALAWVITEIAAYRRHQAGEPMSLSRKTLTILALTFLLPILLGVSFAMAFFIGWTSRLF